VAAIARPSRQSQQQQQTSWVLLNAALQANRQVLGQHMVVAVHKGHQPGCMS
jgi:hypothetical protein